jgi:ABC-type glycerol-3-phosphate transport system substrate-binding protein
MKIWTRSLLAVMVAVLAGLWMAGCGTKEKPNTIHISSWGDPQENAILQDLVTAFMKQNPDIPVKLDRVPYANYLDKLLTQFAAGTAPDVIFVSSENMADFYPRHLLENLNPYLEKDKSIDLKAFYPILLKTYQIFGNTYCIPRDVAPVCVVYYNKKMFQEAGIPFPKNEWTTDEFLDACLKLKKVDAKGNVTQWAFTEDYVMPELWIYDFGGRFVDDSYAPTKYLVDQPEFLAGVKFRADLMLKYKVMPTPASLSQQGGIGTADMLANGQAAMMVSGIWKTPFFRQSKHLPDWDVTMIPRVKGVPRAVIGGSSGYGIVTTSKHKDEAWKLVSYLASADGQKLFSHTGLIQPALKAVAQSPDFLYDQDPKNKKMLLKAVDYSIDIPLMPNWAEVRHGLIYAELDKVWAGTETPEQALENIKAQLAKHPPEQVKPEGK